MLTLYESYKPFMGTTNETQKILFPQFKKKKKYIYLIERDIEESS